MKKLILLILSFSLISSVFAATRSTLELQVSKDHVNLDESFELKTISKNQSGSCGSTTGIDLNATFNQNWEVMLSWGNSSSDVTIPGLEDFQITGTSESTQCSSANGRIESETDKSYILIPKKFGKFTLGPAKWVVSWKSQVESKTVTVEVSHKEGMITNPSPSINNPQKDEQIAPLEKAQFTSGSDQNSFLRNPIVIIGLIFLFLIILAARYIGRLDKQDLEKSDISISSLLETLPYFSTSEEAERYIRDYYARKTWERTENRTYSELLSFETDERKRVILSDIFHFLEGAHYAGSSTDINMINEKINELVDQ